MKGQNLLIQGVALGYLRIAPMGWCLINISLINEMFEKDYYLCGEKLNQ